MTDYGIATLIPPNDFALEDVDLIEKSPCFTPMAKEANMQTADRFRTFFERGLANVSSDTVVLYLSAHGVSREGTAYLLTSEASDADTTGWFPVSQVLEGWAACKAPNKLLVLDATRIESNVHLGLLGNDLR